MESLFAKYFINDEKTGIIRTVFNNYLRDYNEIKKCFSSWWDGEFLSRGIMFVYYQSKSRINEERYSYCYQITEKENPSSEDLEKLRKRSERKMDFSVEMAGRLLTNEC